MSSLNLPSSQSLSHQTSAGSLPSSSTTSITAPLNASSAPEIPRKRHWRIEKRVAPSSVENRSVRARRDETTPRTPLTVRRSGSSDLSPPTEPSHSEPYVRSCTPPSTEVECWPQTAQGDSSTSTTTAASPIVTERPTQLSSEGQSCSLDTLHQVLRPRPNVFYTTQTNRYYSSPSATHLPPIPPKNEIVYYARVPRWQEDSRPFMGCTPIRTVYSDQLLAPLSFCVDIDKLLRYDIKHKGWRARQCSVWVRIEKALLGGAYALRESMHKYQCFSMELPWPTHTGYKEWQSKKKAAVAVRETLSRFAELIGAMSLLIAEDWMISGSRNHWQDVLVLSGQFAKSPDLIEKIANSPINDFREPRVGVWIDVPRITTRFRFYMRGLVAAGVPIMFDWGVNPLSLDLPIESFLTRYKPKDYEIENARTHLNDTNEPQDEPVVDVRTSRTLFTRRMPYTQLPGNQSRSSKLQRLQIRRGESLHHYFPRRIALAAHHRLHASHEERARILKEEKEVNTLLSDHDLHEWTMIEGKWTSQLIPTYDRDGAWERWEFYHRYYEPCSRSWELGPIFPVSPAIAEIVAMTGVAPVGHPSYNPILRDSLFPSRTPTAPISSYVNLGAELKSAANTVVPVELTTGSSAPPLDRLDEEWQNDFSVDEPPTSIEELQSLATSIQNVFKLPERPNKWNVSRTLDYYCGYNDVKDLFGVDERIRNATTNKSLVNWPSDVVRVVGNNVDREMVKRWEALNVEERFSQEAAHFGCPPFDWSHTVGFVKRIQELGQQMHQLPPLPMSDNVLCAHGPPRRIWDMHPESRSSTWDRLRLHNGRACFRLRKLMLLGNERNLQNSWQACPVWLLQERWGDDDDNDNDDEAFGVVLYDPLVVYCLVFSTLTPGWSLNGLINGFSDIGITFSTVAPVEPPSTHMRELDFDLKEELLDQMRTLGIQHRVTGHLFTPSEFLTFVEKLRTLFSRDRILRACLGAGGILWRLAMAFGGQADLSCPSETARVVRIGRFFEGGDDGKLCADAVELEEEQALIGTYGELYVTENKSDHKNLVSFFPPPSAWAQTYPTVEWEEEAEADFQAILVGYSTADVDGVCKIQPRKMKLWKNKYRHLERPRTQFFRAARSAAELFLDSYPEHLGPDVFA